MKYKSILGKTVALTSERRNHIVSKHPELKNYIKKISQVLASPDDIKKSKIDGKALLFYKYFATIKGGKYINVTVKINERNFILTAYITDRIRAGEKYEITEES